MDVLKLIELPEEFSLVHNPNQVALERLFKIDDIKDGATSHKTIPALVELLKPIPDRPGAPSLALGILIQLAVDNNSNKIVMAEAGAIEALTKYLSLGPQNAIEEALAELLRILFVVLRYDGMNLLLELSISWLQYYTWVLGDQDTV
jgi:hypothetical protein